MTRLTIFTFAFVALLAGCSSGSGGNTNPPPFGAATLLSANDVAFLLPLNGSTPEPSYNIGIGRGGDILSESNFENVIEAARNNGTFVDNVIDNPENWFLVSWRYAPCINFAGEGSNTCREQIRFVFQPKIPEDFPGRTQNDVFLDYSIHVNYQFNASETPQDSEVLRAFVALRAFSDTLTEASLTQGQPLDVHPVLSSNRRTADGSPVRREYQDFIEDNIFKQFINDRAPSGMTFMGLGDDNGNINTGEWIFLAGEFDGSGRWRQTRLPDGSGQSVEVLGVSDQGLLTSNITNGPSFNLFERSRVTTDLITNIILPQVSNEHNVNCASCHVADSQALRPNDGGTRFQEDRFRADAFATNIVSVIEDEKIPSQPADESLYLINNDLRGGLFQDSGFFGGQPQENKIVTRVFGYMNNGTAIVSYRMVMDNAKAVTDINKFLGPRLVENPESFALQCRDDRDLEEVYSCLFNGGLTDTISSCFRSCEGQFSGDNNSNRRFVGDDEGSDDNGGFSFGNNGGGGNNNGNQGGNGNNQGGNAGSQGGNGNNQGGNGGGAARVIFGN